MLLIPSPLNKHKLIELQCIIVKYKIRYLYISTNWIYLCKSYVWLINITISVKFMINFQMFCLTPTILMISENIFEHKFDLILINNLLGNKYPFNNNVYTKDKQNKLLFTLKCSYKI